MVPVVRTAVVSMALTGVMIITMWLWFSAQPDDAPAGSNSVPPPASAPEDSTGAISEEGRARPGTVASATTGSRFGSS